MSKLTGRVANGALAGAKSIATDYLGMKLHHVPVNVEGLAKQAYADAKSRANTTPVQPLQPKRRPYSKHTNSNHNQTALHRNVKKVEEIKDFTGKSRMRKTSLPATKVRPSRSQASGIKNYAEALKILGLSFESKPYTFDNLMEGAGVFVPGVGVEVGVAKLGMFAASLVKKAAAILTHTSPFNLKVTHGLTKSKNAFRVFMNEEIKPQGIKIPIKYVEHEGIKYVVDGHHRLEAAKKLDIEIVPIEQVSLPYNGYQNIENLMYYGPNY